MESLESSWCNSPYLCAWSGCSHQAGELNFSFQEQKEQGAGGEVNHTTSIHLLLNFQECGAKVERGAGQRDRQGNLGFPPLEARVSDTRVGSPGPLGIPGEPDTGSRGLRDATGDRNCGTGDKSSPRCPPDRAKGQHMGCRGEMHPPGPTKSQGPAWSPPKYCNSHHRNIQGLRGQILQKSGHYLGRGITFPRVPSDAGLRKVQLGILCSPLICQSLEYCVQHFHSPPQPPQPPAAPCT